MRGQLRHWGNPQVLVNLKAGLPTELPRKLTFKSLEVEPELPYLATVLARK
jgi:hypothetical protein